MLDEIIDYHRWAVYGLLAVMVYNFSAPYLLRAQPPKMIFWTRVGYFAFWAFWSMVVFGGLIVWIFKLREMPPNTLVMMVAAVALIPLDIYRAVQLKRRWIGGHDGVGFNTLMISSELFVTVATVLYALYGK